jgi:transglutaminase-like putative cysteine protease
MIYDVRHRTTFVYEDTVLVSQHVLHLAPRAHPRQRCISTTMTIEPQPSVGSEGRDYFGNPVHYLTVQEPHDRLVVEARSRIEVQPDTRSADLASSLTWQEVRALVEAGGADVLEPYQFAFESPAALTSEAVQAYVLESFAPARPILEAAMDLTSRIHRDFEYRGGVSDVSTPVADVLRMRQGVCQDFAHLEIACLRSLGLPARYVSGYLLTRPPEGKEKLVGSDASHAWVSVWAGAHGWVDFDPTNDMIPGVEHITVGWGRDYNDVSPINGFIVGGGAHQVLVAVDVAPVPSSTARS